MAATGLAGLFQIGIDILSSRRDKDTGAVMVQTGDVVGQTAEADNVELWQHAGLVTIPSNPKPKQAACQGVIIRRGDHDVCVATRDMRGLELAGQLKAGETCLYAGGEDGNAQARVLLKQNGSINLYTRVGNSPTGAGMGIFVNPDDDSISITNSKGYGIIINGDGVFITAKEAGMKILASGAASLIAKGKALLDGATILLGSKAVPVANSALVGPGPTGAPSGKVFIQIA